MTAWRDAAGFVLVGGRSSRMGVDKATLLFRGVPMACHIAAQMTPVVDSVTLVGRNTGANGLDLPAIPDQYPDRGPLGGVVTALTATRSTWNIVTACDVPFLSTDLFSALLDRIRTRETDCVVPVTPDGKEQVLCAVYRRGAVNHLRTIFEAGEARLRFAVRHLSTDYWPVDAGAWSVNLNTPADWAAHAGGEVA